MSRVITRVRRFIESEDGPTAVEYAVLVGLIVVGTIGAISAFSGSMSATFSTVSSSLGSS